MTNRRMQDSDYLYDSEDDLIGLTSAFPPAKGPQSVEYDEGDDAIGLTGAFAPIPDEEDLRSWDEADKWRNFDWASYSSEISDDAAVADAAGQPAGGQSTEAAQGSAPDAAADAAALQGAGAAQAGAQQVPLISSSASASSTGAAATSRGSGRGRHAAPELELTPRMQKARKTRRVLIVLVILAIIVVGVVVFFMYRTFTGSQTEAAQQAQEQAEAPKDEQDMGETLSDDAAEAPAKLTDVPVLTTLLGKTSDDAVEAIGHGAVVTATREVTEEGSTIKTNLNVALTDEPVDSKTGSPTVYLGLDKDDKVVQVGYSASASALGFGSLSFADAVNSEHVIEKTLAKVGVRVPEGEAKLPADKDEYSTYAKDGTTVTRERCSFEGDTEVGGEACTWSAVLSYDYTTQIVTGDLSDTVRVIYVYITQKS